MSGPDQREEVETVLLYGELPALTEEEILLGENRALVGAEFMPFRRRKDASSADTGGDG